jgi:predicted secreted hydrolase
MAVSRRDILLALAAGVALPYRSGNVRAAAPHPRSSAADRNDYAQVTPGRTLRFPADEGSHPEFRVEWWYVTGWLETTARIALGFQVTFFRARAETDGANPSAFAPGQIMIAHAALSDPGHGRLAHDQRVARSAFNLAGAEEGRTHAWIDDWSLSQESSTYRARIASENFGLELTFARTQPPLLQGEDGVSRKGPRSKSASYYYSIPQLKVTGAITQKNRRSHVSGSGWLDHEWSSSYMDERAVGWDWIGLNFDDGASLMVFRMRDRAGAKLWAGGAHRTGDGARRTFKPAEVELTPQRTWRSPRTGATYPVTWRIQAGALDVAIEPLMDDQESDTRASTGAVYWEGAVRALREGKPVGRGYLELTGYLQPMKL